MQYPTIIINKKSELMLIRRATVYSSSCLQVVLVNLSSSFFISTQSTSQMWAATENCKKTLKPLILKVWDHLKLFMLIALKSA